MLTVYYILIFAFLGLFSTSAVLAFWWAVRKGEFRNFQEQAAEIFDADEPEGRLTDVFPGMREAAEASRRGTRVG